MQLSQWNRFRHDTFKDRPDDEMPFILGTGTSSVLAAELDSGGSQPGQSCQIKQVFTFVSQGVHVQKNNKEIPCLYWTKRDLSSHQKRPIQSPKETYLVTFSCTAVACVHCCSILSTVLVRSLQDHTQCVAYSVR